MATTSGCLNMCAMNIVFVRKLHTKRLGGTKKMLILALSTEGKKVGISF